LGFTGLSAVPIASVHDVSIIIAPQKVRVAASTHWVILVFIIVLFDILEHLHKF
jgi:hypothetical protein